MDQRGNVRGGTQRDVDRTVMDMLRQIATQLDDIKMTQRGGLHIDDVSDDE